MGPGPPWQKLANFRHRKCYILLKEARRCHMLDFIKLCYKENKKEGYIDVWPDFIADGRITDLMIRGGAFYAIWDEQSSMWSRSETDAIRLVDMEVSNFVNELKSKLGTDRSYRLKFMKEFSSGKLLEWKKYLKAFPDNYVDLDCKVIFQDEKVTKEDYASKRLPYSLSSGPTPAYDKLMNTLYSPEERDKIEWAIGSIFTGDSTRIQKFLVLYGEGGTGKSTVFNILEQLFEGYTAKFNAENIVNSSNQFALEQFKSNPLVAIQHDGNLSHIEDNSRLNSLVSHESQIVNEKYKSQYEARFLAFLFMGTNKPVMITDAKSGIIRRLIDVSPTGRLLDYKTYMKATNDIRFELGGIAKHCIDKYREMGIDAYNTYKPTKMFSATNDMYNFVYEHYDEFVDEPYVTLKRAWTMYKEYVEETNMSYSMNQRVFKTEFANYFREFDERLRTGNGERYRNVYRGFKSEKFIIREKDYVDLDVFDDEVGEKNEEETEDVGNYISQPVKEDAENDYSYYNWLAFKETESLLDDILADCPAQYARLDGKPAMPWSEVKTTLKDIDTRREHYVLPPDNYIVIDLDILGPDGKKNMEMNLEAAKQFPPTYGEFSRSGGGIHLHYIYDGDLDALSRVYGDNIEVKVYRGGAGLRRKLTYCNSEFMKVISSGLPLKGVKKVLNKDSIKDEQHLRARIKNCLAKKHHGHTAPEVSYIYSSLEQAYKDGIQYDVSDLYKPIKAFALHSSNQSKQCMRLVGKMKFKSAKYEYGDKEGWDPEVGNSKAVYVDFDGEQKPILIFDIEVVPNLVLVCFKRYGVKEEVTRWFNPTPNQLEWFLEQPLVGFNNRAYDNHIIYARYTGKTVYECYKLSKDIIDNKFNGFGPAYRLSYADAYDIATKKQSLKKWEIELASKGKLVHHQEYALNWDEPIPEEKWDMISDYCANDVLATEAVWEAIQEEVRAREILSKLSGLTINERNRAHAASIIFGENKHPELVYTELSTGKRTDGTEDIVSFPGYEFNALGIDKLRYGDNKIVSGKSIYKGQDPGEGGFVYAEPGIYYDVALLDVASMHPSSMLAENIFGEYTQRFRDIVDARLAIKHRDMAKLETLLGGILMDYVGSDEEMDILSKALKLVINSVYGFTTATFDNPFKDPRNVDNIVAKRGALFMIDLKEEVQKRGFTVAHIKTDSIKIPNATPEIIQFVTEFGKKYGYNFEHEATYERMCLVNESVYIAKYDDKGNRSKGGKHAGEWTATGKQFQIPYIFKTLFSHEEITLEDLCETRSVSTKMYLDMNEGLEENEHNYIFVGRVGQFCPIKEGCGGGILVREKKDGSGYDAVNGTKGYRWLESEVVRSSNKGDDIDRTYYNALADDAVETIDKFGSFEKFVGESADLYANSVPFMNSPQVTDDEATFTK